MVGKDKVIDEDTDICLVPPEDDWFFSLHATGSIDPGHQALSASFLVTGCSVDLASAEKIAANLRFE